MSVLDTSALMTVRPTTPSTRATLLTRLLKPATTGRTVARRERYLQQVEAFRTTHSDHSTLRTGGSAWPDFN
ncbi:hypothetical protein [Tersicoccus sp. Bi-70]|uniref:hypothetical protein n=1 Tax=Tersicoccus sp. Bi-70 TaxID=1897634 RepID=UPI0009759320|nr:hypothetical protein [Tersicoccus sp. Bi-70]OMH30613.1 hypothetical protein BGP79_11670 [Tersicoccus sp. Bi-70]